MYNQRRKGFRRPMENQQPRPFEVERATGDGPMLFGFSPLGGWEMNHGKSQNQRCIVGIGNCKNFQGCCGIEAHMEVCMPKHSRKGHVHVKTANSIVWEEAGLISGCWRYIHRLLFSTARLREAKYVAFSQNRSLASSR